MLHPRLAVVAALLRSSLCVASARVNGPLRGEYGFLSEFDHVTPEEAKARIRHMQGSFGIMEFQFVNAFGSFSKPPSKDANSWSCSYDKSVVRRDILLAYIEEIVFWGGRAWLVVESMATDPDDVAVQKKHHIVGKNDIGGMPLMDVVAPTQDWAESIVPEWAEFALSLGFSGIHWGSIGNFQGQMSGIADITGFLNAAKPILDSRSLGQTFNFVDGFGWDHWLVLDNVVAFTVWSAWQNVKEEEVLANIPAGSVFVCYPGRDGMHSGEAWNQDEVGKDPLDLIVARWHKARCFGDSYLAIGDGNRHVTTDHFPDARELRDDQVEMIVKNAFKVGEESCAALGVPFIQVPVRKLDVDLPGPSTDRSGSEEGDEAAAEVLSDAAAPSLRAGRSAASRSRDAKPEAAEDGRAAARHPAAAPWEEAGITLSSISPAVWLALASLLVTSAAVGATIMWALLRLSRRADSSETRERQMCSPGTRDWLGGDQ